MADYSGVFRSNYFRVTDVQKLKEIVSKMDTTYGSVELFEDDAPYYGFGGDGDLLGIWPETENETQTDDEYLESDFDLMIQKLQEILVDDDAIIIMFSGNEKLCYVVGSAMVITKTESRFLNVKELAKDAARVILQDDTWDTICEY